MPGDCTIIDGIDGSGPGGGGGGGEGAAGFPFALGRSNDALAGRFIATNGATPSAFASAAAFRTNR